MPASSTTGQTLDSLDVGVRFIRGTAVRLVVYGLTVLMSIASAPLVTRHLGATGYGYFATATAIVLIVGGFTEAGLNAFGVREYATGRPDRDELLGSLVGLRISATGFAIMCVSGIGALVGAPKVLVYGVLVAGFSLMITIAGENYGIPLTANLRLTTAAVLTLVQQAVLTGGYVALVILGAGVVPLLGMAGVSGCALLISTLMVTRGETSFLPSFDRKQWWEILTQTLPYAAASAVGVIYFREALVMISALSTGQQTGYYAGAFRVVEVLTLLPWQLVTAVFPILSHAANTRDHDRLRHALQRLLDTGLILGLWVSISVALGATFAIAVIGGHQFAPSVRVLQVQGISVLASFIVAVYSSVLLSTRQSMDLVKANVVAVVVTTVLSVALIPSMGAEGAAIATVVAETSLAIGYAAMVHRRWPDLHVSLKSVPRVALAAIVSGGITVALPLSSAESLFVFTPLYFIANWVLGTLPPEVFDALLRRHKIIPDGGGGERL